MKTIPINLETVTVGEWLEFWFKTYKKDVLRPYSIRNIEQVIRIHTPPTFKQLQMREVKTLDVDFVLSQIPNGRTRLYVRQVYNCAFSKAYACEIVSKNVVEFTEKVRYKKENGKALSLMEQKEFVSRLDGRRVKWIMLFYLNTGVRRTEATELRWQDINEKESLILIRGSKTVKSYRYIFLTKEVKEILSNQKKQIEREKGTKFESKNPDKVFDWSACYISQIFKKLCPNHHLHDLRHTYITRCAESGVNINVCQQLVGHSTANMTLNVYTHVLDDFKRKEASKFTLNPY